MSNPLHELPLSVLLSNLSNLTVDFATTIISNSFEGIRKSLLLRFLHEEITEKDVERQWDSIPFSGNLAKDVKIPELSVIDRLALLTFTLNKLKTIKLVDESVVSTYYTTLKDLNEVFLEDEYELKTLVSTLTTLLNDLVNKNSLKIKRKDAQELLILSLLSQEVEEIEEVEEVEVKHLSDSLIGSWDTLVPTKEESVEDNSSVNRKHMEVIGDGVEDTFILNHNFGTYEFILYIYWNIGSKEMDRIPDYDYRFTKLNENSLELVFKNLPKIDEYRVVLIRM